MIKKGAVPWTKAGIPFGMEIDTVSVGKRKVYTLAAENEKILKDWLTVIKNVLEISMSMMASKDSKENLQRMLDERQSLSPDSMPSIEQMREIKKEGERPDTTIGHKIRRVSGVIGMMSETSGGAGIKNARNTMNPLSPLHKELEVFMEVAQIDDKEKIKDYALAGAPTKRKSLSMVNHDNKNMYQRYFKLISFLLIYDTLTYFVVREGLAISLNTSGPQEVIVSLQKMLI